MTKFPNQVADGCLEPGSVTPSLATLSIAGLLDDALKPTGVEVGRALIETYGSLRQMASATHAELRRLGVGPEGIRRLEAIFAIAKYYGEEEWMPGKPFHGSYDVYAHCRERLASETVEHFYVVLLDNKNRKLKEVLVSKGSLTSSIVNPRDIYLPVIRESAAGVIFLHNHPSGDPTPSLEDIQLTRRLREVGDLIGVRVLDHVVIGKGRYVSFVDDGYW